MDDVALVPSCFVSPKALWNMFTSKKQIRTCMVQKLSDTSKVPNQSSLHAKKTFPSKEEQNTTPIYNFENEWIYNHQNVSNKTGRTSEFLEITFWGPWKSSLWYHCPRDRFPRVEPSLRFHYLPCLTMSCWYLQKLTLSRHFYQPLKSYLLWQNKCNPHQL